MLSNAYFLAKFRFDTAENEPAKNLQTFAKFWKLLPCYLPEVHARLLNGREEIRGVLRVRAVRDQRRRPTPSTNFRSGFVAARS